MKTLLKIGCISIVIMLLLLLLGESTIVHCEPLIISNETVKNVLTESVTEILTDFLKSEDCKSSFKDTYIYQNYVFMKDHVNKAVILEFIKSVDWIQFMETTVNTDQRIDKILELFKTFLWESNSRLEGVNLSNQKVYENIQGFMNNKIIHTFNYLKTNSVTFLKQQGGFFIWGIPLVITYKMGIPEIIPEVTIPIQTVFDTGEFLSVLDVIKTSIPQVSRIISNNLTLPLEGLHCITKGAMRSFIESEEFKESVYLANKPLIVISGTIIIVAGAGKILGFW